MNSPQEHRSSSLNLDDHSDIASGRPIDESTPREIREKGLGISRSRVSVEPSLELSLSEVPGLFSAFSAGSSDKQHSEHNQLKDSSTAAVTRAQNQSDDMMPAEVPDSSITVGAPPPSVRDGGHHTSHGFVIDSPLATPNLLNITTSPLSPLSDTPPVQRISSSASVNPGGTSSSPSAGLYVSPTIPSLRAALMPRPTLIVPPNDQDLSNHDVTDRLPVRHDPPAVTTMDRLRRNVGNLLRRKNETTNDGHELDPVPRFSEGRPRLFSDGTAAAMRAEEQERQRGDDGLAPRVQQVRQQVVVRNDGAWQRRRTILAWGGCTLAGLIMFGVVYGAVSMYKKPE